MYNRIGQKIQDVENSPFGLGRMLGAASLIALDAETKAFMAMANLDRATKRVAGAKLSFQHRKGFRNR